MTYQEYENKGRKKLAGYIEWPLEFQTDIFAHYDASYTSDTHTFNAEVKDRDIPFEKYAAYGFMLEKIKYDALMAAYSETGSIPTYWNFFQQGIGCAWNLLKIMSPKWEWKLCTKATAEGEYGKEKELKLVTFVFPIDGEMFNYG